MLMSAEHKLPSLFCSNHEVIHLLHSPIEYGDLCLVLGKNIARDLQKRVLWIIKILKTLAHEELME